MPRPPTIPELKRACTHPSGSGASACRLCAVNLRSAVEAHRVAMEKHGKFLFNQCTDVLWLGDYSFTRE